MEVRRIESKQTHEWLLYKHYAHRLPSISYAFGLFREGILIGVCTFGSALPMQMRRGVCGVEHQFSVFELNRLCIEESQPPNTLSFFVSQCLKQLPPMIVVSYADMKMNHHGYIYQATNFLYTGISHQQMDWKIKGQENRHTRAILDEFAYSKNRPQKLKEKYGDLLYKEMRPPKHRYVYFVGDKKQKKIWRKALKYPLQPYPKGKNDRYDAGYKPETTLLMPL